MVCTRPIHGFRAQGGQVTFSRKLGFVDRPATVTCGQCPDCRARRARDWAIRAMHEAETSESSCFVTLTYSEENLPEDRSVDVSHWQKFAKRLRKRIGPFRFLHCGEYGGRFGRPHYHACLFGTNFSFDRRPVEGGGQRRWHSPLLEEVWGHGYVSLDELTFGSARYVASYIQKKLNGPEGHVEYEQQGLRPPYATMSRRPGLGTAWFSRYRNEVYPADEVVAEGRRYRPPRFYDQLLEKEDPDTLERVQKGRMAIAARHAADHSRDRLVAREKVAEARLSLYRP